MILDIGCGTGNHLLELVRRGYEVVGVDYSQEMLNIAKEKLRIANLQARLERMDMRKLKLNRIFDAAIMMFATINYVTSNQDLNKVFKGIRKAIKNGGLLIFDFWYGPAVLMIRPSTRMKIVKQGRIRLIRFVVPELDTLTHTCISNYHLLVFKGKNLIEEIKESHVLRYLFPQEVKHYLNENGFELIKLCAFPSIDQPPSESTWNVAAISKAV